MMKSIIKIWPLYIKKAINDKYLNQNTGIYGSGVQTELSMALQWKIVLDELIDEVAQNLADRVKADGMHLDVGVLGAKAILNALSDHNHAEVAYELAVQDTYPCPLETGRLNESPALPNIIARLFFYR